MGRKMVAGRGSQPFTASENHSSEEGMEKPVNKGKQTYGWLFLPKQDFPVSTKHSLELEKI